MPEHSMSIATRVIITILAMAVLLLGIYFITSYVADRDRLSAKLQVDLAVDADRLATGLTLPVWNFDHEQIERVIESTMKDEEVAGVEVKLKDIRSTIHAMDRDAGWNIKPHHGPFQSDGWLSEKRDIRADDDLL